MYHKLYLLQEDIHPRDTPDTALFLHQNQMNLHKVPTGLPPAWLCVPPCHEGCYLMLMAAATRLCLAIERGKSCDHSYNQEIRG